MGQKYTSQSASGYNSSPPADDGSTTESNRVKWATIKTKLTDTLKAYIDAINSQLVSAFDVAASSVVGTYNTVAADNGRTLDLAGTFTVSLADAATVGAGYTVTFKNLSGVQTIALVTNTNKLDTVTNGTVTLTTGQSRTYRLANDGISYELIGESNIGTVIGGVINYAGSVATMLGGYLAVDGSSQLRTDFPLLFAAIGTAWGSVDGTHFNLPPAARMLLGSGQATTVETLTSVAAASNQVPVASNTKKWITGMQVVTSGVTGFGGALTNGTYFIERVDATHVKFHTTLEQAQNSTSDVTVTGTGSMVITWTGSSRSLGEIGGEQNHAMSNAEILAHTHAPATVPTRIGGTGGSIAETQQPLSSGGSSTDATVTLASFGGNAGMNIMPPFAVFNQLIRYQ